MPENGVAHQVAASAQIWTEERQHKSGRLSTQNSLERLSTPRQLGDLWLPCHRKGWSSVATVPIPWYSAEAATEFFFAL